MKEEKVVLGRVSKGIQKVLGVSWKNSNIVYMQSSVADDIARRYEDAYLKVISEISSITKKPNFVIYDKDKKTLYLLKCYLSKGKIRTISICLKKEGMFYFKSFKEIRNDETYQEFEGLIMNAL